LTQALPESRKKLPFQLFDEMVAEKYGLTENQFENMSRKDRNKMLMKMLEAENQVILFPRKL
jgi:hypothetical protein